MWKKIQLGWAVVCGIAALGCFAAGVVPAGLVCASSAGCSLIGALCDDDDDDED
jgi:hypothetical protein